MLIQLIGCLVFLCVPACSSFINSSAAIINRNGTLTEPFNPSQLYPVDSIVFNSATNQSTAQFLLIRPPIENPSFCAKYVTDIAKNNFSSFVFESTEPSRIYPLGIMMTHNDTESSCTISDKMANIVHINQGILPSNRQIKFLILEDEPNVSSYVDIVTHATQFDLVIIFVSKDVFNDIETSIDSYFKDSTTESSPYLFDEGNGRWELVVNIDTSSTFNDITTKNPSTGDPMYSLAILNLAFGAAIIFCMYRSYRKDRSTSMPTTTSAEAGVLRRETERQRTNLSKKKNLLTESEFDYLPERKYEYGLYQKLIGETQKPKAESENHPKPTANRIELYDTEQESESENHEHSIPHSRDSDQDEECDIAINQDERFSSETESHEIPLYSESHEQNSIVGRDDDIVVVGGDYDNVVATNDINVAPKENVVEENARGNYCSDHAKTVIAARGYIGQHERESRGTRTVMDMVANENSIAEEKSNKTALDPSIQRQSQSRISLRHQLSMGGIHSRSDTLIRQLSSGTTRNLQSNIMDERTSRLSLRSLMSVNWKSIRIGRDRDNNTNNDDIEAQLEDVAICNDENGDTCPICIDEFVTGEIVIALPRCKHIYHKECLRTWLLTKKGCCPLCKVYVLDEQALKDSLPTVSITAVPSRAREPIQQNQVQGLNSNEF